MTKDQYRKEKQYHRLVKQGLLPHLPVDRPDAVDCACVIHGEAYPWCYVDRLYSMLVRNISRPVRLHVLTESDRVVPPHMIKHEITQWPNMGTKRSRAWWYKIQLFRPEQFANQILYLDLDVVITGSLDWLFGLNPRYFWTIRDFRYLWRPEWQGINSSVMFWDPLKFDYIWHDFDCKNPALIMNQYHGDQDYITNTLKTQDKKFINEKFVSSWRWQIKDGGLDVQRRVPINPHAGTVIPQDTKLIVFHGAPKPHELHDPVINQFWS